MTIHPEGMSMGVNMVYTGIDIYFYILTKDVGIIDSVGRRTKKKSEIRNRKSEKRG